MCRWPGDLCVSRQVNTTRGQDRVHVVGLVASAVMLWFGAYLWTRAETLERALHAFVERHMPRQQAQLGGYELGLIPVGDVLAFSASGAGFIRATGLSAAQILLAIGALVLGAACLNYVHLAVARSLLRAREVGIRKALGADSDAIARLMLWDLIHPLLWATVIAWPLAYYFMARWLQGFAYRIDLSTWMFLAAGAAGLVIAVLTVLPQVLRVCRGRAVEAIRSNV